MDNVFIIFDSHCNAVETLKDSCHFNENSNVIREIFKSTFAKVQCSQRLIQANINSYKSQYSFYVFTVFEG